MRRTISGCAGEIIEVIMCAASMGSAMGFRHDPFGTTEATV
jgi:hypothetical protein